MISLSPPIESSDLDLDEEAINWCKIEIGFVKTHQLYPHWSHS